MKKVINKKFLHNYISSFQDFDNLYLVTNYYEGLTLNNYKDQIMTEEQIKFIAACVIQSLTYLREKNIIHRDLRMNNLILDRNNYINLIDFSYAISYSKKNNLKNYIIGNKFDNAPEIQNHSIYDYNSDYYRLGGSIIYYLIFKKYINEVKKKVKVSNLIIEYNKNISDYSFSCIDFINKLITNDYKKRIGFRSINELKSHTFFKDFSWIDLEMQKIKSPLNFNKTKNTKSFCVKSKYSKINEKLYYRNIKKKRFQKLLKKFDYVNKIIIKKILASINNEIY